MNGQNKRARRRTLAGPAALLDRVLALASPYNSSLLLLIVFLVVIAVGLFVIRDLHTTNVEAQKMYAGSVLGLHRIGELQYQAQETRRSTFYALTTNDSNLQLEYADQSREADRRVNEGISEYLLQARMPHEIELGKRLQRDWSEYLSVRNEVLASILEGITKEAVNLDLKGGVPAFERVRQDLEEINRLYDEQASQQLANVAATSRRTIFRLIGVLGITLALASASVWAIQRSKMLGAIQLAKLQMEFVASVSHELRTPLAVISSAADNIADGVVGGNDQLKRYGSAIQNQCRQITELVNQILLFASTKDRKNRYTLRPLQVSQIIDSVLDNTAELVRGAGFVIEHHIETGLPFVMGDLSALSQCLQNLIVNALKYSGESRWIGIRAFVHDSEERSGKEIRIIVQDRGIGIDRSEMPHIFEPFYRGAEVSAAQIHGTGLGLSLAKSIAEAMRGTLSVVSELAVGSIFTLRLPIVEKQELEMTSLNSEPNPSIRK
jgi:signal transduction histidine kinase